MVCPCSARQNIHASRRFSDLQVGISTLAPSQCSSHYWFCSDLAAASRESTAELVLGLWCRKEQDFEQRTGNNYFRGYRSESITYYGQTLGLTLPQQMQPGMHAGFASLGLLVTMFMIGAYLAVAARLASIWKRTRYLSHTI